MYEGLIQKLKLTGNYIDKLARIESDIINDVENYLLDKKVGESITKCIDEINKIYCGNEESVLITKASLDASKNKRSK